MLWQKKKNKKSYEIDFKDLTTQQILDSYDFSDRFLRLFACACAEYAMGKVKDPDPRSLNAIAVARRYALGEATEQELASASTAAHAVYSAAHSNVYIDSYAYATAFAAYHTTSSSFYAASHAASNVPNPEAKAILIKMINDLTELERLMILK